MKSYTELITEYKNISNNQETANETQGKSFINEGLRAIYGKQYMAKFLEDTGIVKTVVDQQAYFLPYNCKKVLAVTRTTGGTRYKMKQIKSKDKWNILNDTDVSGDMTEYYYITARGFEVYPIPSTADENFTFSFKKNTKELGIADYDTGTITITNDSTAIVGSGTTFTALMVGRFLKATNDGYWYKITGFTDTTHIVIEQVYQGTTEAGASYAIGEMSDIPSDYQMLPVFYGVSKFWLLNNDIQKSREYERMFNDGMKDLKESNISSTFDIRISDKIDFVNPNYYFKNLT